MTCGRAGEADESVRSACTRRLSHYSLSNKGEQRIIHRVSMRAIHKLVAHKVRVVGTAARARAVGELREGDADEPVRSAYMKGFPPYKSCQQGRTEDYTEGDFFLG